MSQPAIQIEHLTCRFGKTVAVDDLSLVVEAGKIFGFIGENGAGKTTTIRTLMGLLRPTSGEVRVLGDNPLGGNAGLLQRIGYVSDDRAMYRWMKVSEALRFNAGLYGNWDKQYANNLAHEFELELSKRIRELSRGQLAKLALLSALATHPEVLILDEASSGLDAIVRRTILEKLIDVSSQQGATIFLSSHLIEEVDRVSEHIAILCRGKLIANGLKDEIRSSLSRVVFSGVEHAIDVNSQDWVLSSKQIEKEVQIIVRDLNTEKMETLKQRVGGTPQVVEMSLEDTFAEYTAWGKRG
jgi:ABC-2 type transport system ATP-binding protein